MMQADTPPNQTIYINNLNEKVKKEGECAAFGSYFLVRTGERSGARFAFLQGFLVLLNL